MNSADLEILKQVRNCLDRLGFGQRIGLLGNNNAHLGNLLCDGRNGYEVENGKDRECTLNSHDLKCVERIAMNNADALSPQNECLYEQFDDLIHRLERKEVHGK